MGGANFHETCTNILQKPIRFPSTFSRASVELLTKLLSRDPATRLKTAAAVKRQSWFKGIKWNKLALKKIPPPFHIAVGAEGSTEHFDQVYTRMEITSEDQDSLQSQDSTSEALFEDF